MEITKRATEAQTRALTNVSSSSPLVGRVLLQQEECADDERTENGDVLRSQGVSSHNRLNYPTDTNKRPGDASSRLRNSINISVCIHALFMHNLLYTTMALQMTSIEKACT